ncbi:MAG: hypothetical protein ABDH28_00025 [Brevinematia bacterium]
MVEAVLTVVVAINSVLIVLLVVRQNIIEKLLEKNKKSDEDRDTKEVKTIADNKYDDFKDYLGI